MPRCSRSRTRSCARWPVAASALLDRYAAGMNANQRAALKAFIITLDLRDESLQASEEAIRAKAAEITA